MLAIRKSNERGTADYGWLKAKYSFSFADYEDPRYEGFGALRVLNEDWVAPGQGFKPHPHRDMEIVSYPLQGAIEHRDSLGNHRIYGVGDVQRMSAGRGIVHSEFNASPTEPEHHLQIWITPNVAGIQPEYEQRRFAEHETRNRLRLIASPDGREESVRVHADALIYAIVLDAGRSLSYRMGRGRRAYLHVARGEVEVNDRGLGEGDGVMVSNEEGLTLSAQSEAEVLLFDLG